jgi:hypothetical protein
MSLKIGSKVKIVKEVSWSCGWEMGAWDIEQVATIGKIGEIVGMLPSVDHFYDVIVQGVVHGYFIDSLEISG